MRYRKSTIGALGVLLVSLVIAGCLVSGTFVVVENVAFDFTAQTGFYWYPVDLSGNSVWEDHKDDIDFIDAVGFAFVITNTSDQISTLNAWLVATSGEADTNNEPTEVDSSGVQIVKNLTVPAMSSVTVTYAESLGMISSVSALKTIIKSGRFDYYGTSTGGPQDPFNVTEGKIIVTISASGT